MNNHSINNLYYKILKSSLLLENPFYGNEEILNWVKERNEEVKVQVNQIEFNKLRNWSFSKEEGALKHSSNKFFSIKGLQVDIKYQNQELLNWEQPIINQPEIGYLGFITKEIEGVLYFLVQAKIEPGNVNCVQLSPTVQATKSNYTKVHGGRFPNYLEYFINVKPENVILDQLQSEQGARFFRKRNRNIIINVEEDIELKQDFRWLTLGQIKYLMSFDNIINMDTRTVISGLLYGDYKLDTYNFFNIIKGNQSSIGNHFLKSLLVHNVSKRPFQEIIHWLTDLKSKYELHTSIKSVFDITDWEIGEKTISQINNDYFEVIGVTVEIGNREVVSWDQPLIKPMHKGICAFIVKEIKGIYHFLVQGRVEPGFMDTIEMAPTVQCSSVNNKNMETIPFLSTILNANSDEVLYDTYQSEEGGRFYKEQNRNMIIKVNDSFSEEVPSNYNWLTLNQLKKFIQFNNFVNIQARSLISAISYI
ncbi:hypothetical protein UJ101_00308 [Flavobacteriaceae bacterium UJ101]|nr:hypothetical protein UJ101_00308 [Flavobacteriaceae bacterium UJ101]